MCPLEKRRMCGLKPHWLESEVKIWCVCLRPKVVPVCLLLPGGSQMLKASCALFCFGFRCLVLLGLDGYLEATLAGLDLMRTDQPQTRVIPLSLPSSGLIHICYHALSPLFLRQWKFTIENTSKSTIERRTSRLGRWFGGENTCTANLKISIRTPSPMGKSQM